ncbi:rhamnulokinase [Celerinatantimonas sp. YJH-8]|uniref:rhamnulokinase n=1 Tax=Celerinatantimonas sp. YJH-8 TaxID=3228714 RepID=UPI0038C4DA21
MHYYVAAIDLGASSGRVILGIFDKDNQSLLFREIHRFKNQLVLEHGHLCWDIDHLEKEIKDGLNQLLNQGDITLNSLGIDSWGVDYVCLDSEGQRIGPAIAYRDDRTCEVSQQLLQQIGEAQLYQQTGIQFQPFNSIFQFKAQADDPFIHSESIHQVLMIPDYLHYRLTGEPHWEYTNASTSGLLDVDARDWAPNLLQAAQIDPDWLGEVRFPGEQIGTWQAPNGQQIPVISPPTHDTAAAVAATPLRSSTSAYISSGTWSLIGVEREQPCTSAMARQANLTNEGGANGHYRILKNVMGMWLVQGLLAENPELTVEALTDRAAQYPLFTSLIDPNHPVFVHPDSMTQAIQDYCQATNQTVPESVYALTRCVLDSLALSYWQSLRQIETACECQISEIHVVGGGSKNTFLNQLCANVCQKPVFAGPDEASALGNIGYQLMGLGAIEDDRQLRQVIAQNFPQQHYRPQQCIGLAAAQARFNALPAMASLELKSEELI